MNARQSPTDFEQVCSRSLKVLNRVNAVETAAAADPADAHDRPAAKQHLAVAPLAFHRVVVEMPIASAVSAPVFNVAVKTFAAPDLAVVVDDNATNGTAVALANKAVTCLVSARTNKRHSPRRYSPISSSSVTITTVLLQLFVSILLPTAAGAQDVIVLYILGAVAEKIKEVAVDLGSAQFVIVLRLVIYDIVHNNKHSCLTNDFTR